MVGLAKAHPNNLCNHYALWLHIAATYSSDVMKTVIAIAICMHECINNVSPVLHTLVLVLIL